ncbi:unnamed protein product, partial [Symbiodinium sp. KB8]
MAAALVTEKIRLGTSVDILTERHPIIRGRELATLDVASNGRVEYGVGSGWSREEYAAMGITFERRGARLNEYMDALKALWGEHRPSFDGEFVSFEPLIFMPKPVRGTIPIVVGGNSPAALRRVATRGDGWHGWRLEPDELKRTLDDLHVQLDEHGRSRDDVKLNVGIPFKGSLDELAEYAEICRGLGIDELIIAAGVSRTRFREQLTELADAAGATVIGLWNLARANPSHVAAIETDTGRSVTRGELAARTHQVVNALRERGMKEGSVIGIVLENEIPFLEVFFAGLQAGWYVVPLNYHFTSDEIGYILADSDAEAVVCSKRYADTVAVAAERAGIPNSMRLCVDGHEGFEDYDVVVGAASDAEPDGRTAGWMMTYTSGTTGSPKGIKRPLSGMDPDDVGEVWSLPMRIFGIEGDRHIHMLQSPVYHTAVLVYANASAQFGHTIVMMRRWDAEDALRQIERHRVTTSHM